MTIAESLKKMRATTLPQSVVGKVVATDAESATVDIEPINGDTIIYSVRLQADFQNQGIVIFPKQDSIVVATLLENESAFVSMFSEVEKVVVQKGGFDLKEQFNLLLQLNSDLVEMLSRLKIQTNTGIGSVLPNQVVDFLKMKADLAKIKEKFNLIL
jgi:hypothetical protein